METRVVISYQGNPLWFLSHYGIASGQILWSPQWFSHDFQLAAVSVHGSLRSVYIPGWDYSDEFFTHLNSTRDAQESVYQITSCWISDPHSWVIKGQLTLRSFLYLITGFLWHYYGIESILAGDRAHMGYILTLYDTKRVKMYLRNIISTFHFFH